MLVLTQRLLYDPLLDAVLDAWNLKAFVLINKVLKYPRMLISTVSRSKGSTIFYTIKLKKILDKKNVL